MLSFKIHSLLKRTVFSLSYFFLEYPEHAYQSYNAIDRANH